MAIKKEKDYLIADIVKLSTQSKSYQGYYGRDAIRILHAYIELMVHTMLQGFSFTIPAVGTFCISKVKHTKVVSLKQLDYIYKVMFVGEKIDNAITKFRESHGFLKKILFKVNIENHDFKTAS